MNNYREYYNDHPDYIALRSKNSAFYNQYVKEVKYWKSKYLFELIKELPVDSIADIGCATGILLAEFPAKTPRASRYGIDISPENITSARENFPDIYFFAGCFEEFLHEHQHPEKFDLVILSDILEHIDDDVGLLALAGANAKYVVLNLPLEKCPEFEGREYGLHDKHGHLRAYNVTDARDLVRRAGMKEVASIMKQYVLEPVFRQYLAEKLFLNRSGDEKLQGLAQYISEINRIDLDPSYYKSNYFGLLSCDHRISSSR